MTGLRHKISAKVRRFRKLHRCVTHARTLLTRALPHKAANGWRKMIPPTAPCSLPCGTFSLLEVVERAPRGEGRVIERDQGRALLKEPSVSSLCKLGQNSMQPWPVFWGRQEKARLVGRSLVQRNTQGQLCIEGAYGSQAVNDDPAYWYAPCRKPLRLEGRWTSVVSRWVPSDAPTNFAHWLFDALPRLAVLAEIPADTAIIVPQRLLAYQRESLELLGISARVRPTYERHVEVDEYFFSAPTAMIVCFNPYAAQFLRRTFLSHARCEDSGKSRVFIRRRGAMRTAANAAEVNAFLRGRGWEIYDLEDLPFTQQIRLFAGADAISGIHGAGFSNIVWCRPGTKVIELFSDAYLSGCFECLADATNLDYHYRIFPSDENFNAIVDIERLRELFDRLGV